jgi:3-oxoacyl-[acyl-carrier-protein] synthase-3
MIANVSGNGRRVGITGIGVYAPERVLTNADLERMVETNDQWIVERTGIRERRIASAEEAASDLAVPAARSALEQAGVDPADLDLVVVATSTPDMLFPSTGALVAKEIGATKAAGYDTLAACSGFLYGVSQAYGTIAGGVAEKALVVGSETLSKIVNWEDRSTCILFGDGAGAAVLEPVEQGGFLGFELGVDATYGADLCLPAGGSRTPTTPETAASDLHWVHMNGREIFRVATRLMVSSAEELLGELGLTVEDVDLYVAHQANQRIIDHAARNLGLPREKVFLNIDRYGNTSAASIPIGLAEAVELGRLEPGMKVLMSAVGGGITWGSALLEWSPNGAPA